MIYFYSFVIDVLIVLKVAELAELVAAPPPQPAPTTVALRGANRATRRGGAEY